MTSDRSSGSPASIATRAGLPIADGGPSALCCATMTVLPGFTVPEELRLLGDQVRRFVADEIVPLEQTIDPDAPELPREEFLRPPARTRAAGLWALAAPEQYGGGGLDTFSMCVVLEAMSQHRMGLYNPGGGAFGRHSPPPLSAGRNAAT